MNHITRPVPVTASLLPFISIQRVGMFLVAQKMLFAAADDDDIDDSPMALIIGTDELIDLR